jgi:hypothetical protein
MKKYYNGKIYSYQNLKERRDAADCFINGTAPA